MTPIKTPATDSKTPSSQGPSKSNNYIIGGGLIALVAKKLFPDWNVIPVGKSLFYSYYPPLADPYINAHADVDGLMKSLAPHTMTYMVKSAVSLAGDLVFFSSPLAIKEYLRKIYGDDMHPAALPLMKMERFVYGTSAQSIYKDLHDKYSNNLAMAHSQFGNVVNINTHERTIQTENKKVEYDKIISTVPLHVMEKWCYTSIERPSKDIHYRHIATSSLDFENSEIVYVADQEIPFHKVVQHSPVDYVFESFYPLTDEVLSAFVGHFQQVNSTFIRGALPCGPPPKPTHLSFHHIHCVGSLAQHDDMMCVSSCFRRLIKLVSELHV